MTNDTASSDNKRHKTNDDRGDDSAAARSAVETETVICGQSKSDGSQTDADTENDTIFTKGQTVFYTSSEGVAEEALILEVHVDDLLVPYYTIRLLNGDREKQTDGARISTLSDLCKSPKSNLIEKSPPIPSRPLRSILRPSSYGRNRSFIPVTPDCKGNDGYTMPLSSKHFLQSIEKKISQRKTREKRAAQVVTPDSDCQTNHRLDVTPTQLLYTRARKRKRSDDDDDDIDATRERKRRRLANWGEVEIRSTGKDPLPFHFMSGASKLSSSTRDINCNPRIYPDDMVPNVPLDWPINGGGYCPISFHDKRSQRDESHSIDYQMLVFDEILSKLDNDATEESARTGTSITSFLSPVATFLSSISANYVSTSWEYIRSKLLFGGVSVKQTRLEVAASDQPVSADSNQACSEAAAADDVAQSISISALRTNVTSQQKPTTQQANLPQNVASKPLLPRPPDRWQEAFSIKAGHWKCKSCFHQNPPEAMTCDVCTALRDDRRVSNDAHPSDESDGSQSEGSVTEDSDSRTGDSYSDDDTQTTSETEADDDTRTNNTDTDDSQTDDSVKPTEADTSTKAKTEEDFSTSTNVAVINEGRRRSSLALAVERIRADRAINAAFNAHHNASEQPSLSEDVARETNRNKRLRRGIWMELGDDSTGTGAERATAGVVTEQLEVVDLDLAPFLEAPLETDVESMSVTSNMSLVSRNEMMELDGALHKRGNNEFTSNGKKQRYG